MNIEKTKSEKPKTFLIGGNKKESIKTTYYIIVIAAIFSVVVSLLLLLNYTQLKNNDPIESETLSALVERLSDDPNNEQLKNEIRAFDLMARKAFFTGRWQIEAGGWLLLLGAIVFAVALRYYYSLTSKIDEPESEEITQQTSRILSSRWILITGLLIITSGVIASFFSFDNLSQYETLAQVTPDNEVDEIEIIDLTKEESKPVAEEVKTPVVAETVSKEIKEEEETNTTIPNAVKEEKVQEAKSINYPSLADLKKQFNSFRGAWGHGISYAKNAPISWNIETNENVLWKVKVPLHGYSSPVIWGDKLFVTGANNAERWIYCYNKNDGKIIWQQQANNISGSPAKAPKTTDDTGLAAPSVVCDGNFVVAIFGTGDIIAFDMEGNRTWAKNLGVPDNHYGHSSSLISWQEKVFVQYDTNKGGRLLALNIQNGDIIWDVKRSSNISWASPILIEVDTKVQIITSTEPTVAGYDIESGKELWKVDCMMGEVGPSPGYGNGLVFVANEYATLAAIDPSKGEVVWEDNYYLPEVASPVVSDDLLFIATSYGVLACFDVHTHNMYWEVEFSEGIYSSPIVVDGKIYTIDMNGTVHIFKVDREKQKVADINIGESITTTPAFENNRIYVRSAENMYCFGK